MATKEVTSTREARRRRIAERGPDRLALITGKIHSIPHQSPSPPAAATIPDQSPSPPAATIPDQSPSPPAATDSPKDEVVAIRPSLPVHHDSGGRDSTQHPIVNEALERLLPSLNKGTSIASRAVSLLGIEKEISQVSSSLQSTVLENQDEPQSHHSSSLTSGQIRSAISASENIRLYCSIAAAILVILSYIGLPILGWTTIRSIIVFRPVYLLLLTNISIVLARLILGTQGSGSRSRTLQTSNIPTLGANGLFDQMGKALEVGLLLQNIFGALFIDFSIYAVVLVCGLSMIQRLGL